MVIAKVAFDYVADQEDELNLKVGDIVTNIEQQDGGWWEGEVNGKRGMFPENFVEVIKDEPQSPQPPKSPEVPKPPMATAQEGVKRARVTFEYSPEQPDEIALSVGAVIEILEDEDEGWWKGKLGDGKVGMFPSNFVEMIKDEPSPATPLPEPLEPTTIAPPADTGIKSNRPKSQIGFGISLGDLNRDKLKKTGKSTTDGAPKKADPPPPSVEKKSLAPPVPLAPKEMVTKSIQKAKVTFAYEPEQADELKLNVGDVLVITNKNIFDGWMQGELNGKVGLFPDNFVELLPLENIRVESNDEPNQLSRDTKKSVKRAAKENPAQTEPPPPEKPKNFGSSAPPGVGNLKLELEKKLAVGGGKPPPPGGQKPKSKPPPPGPPAKPTKPKPPPPVQSKPSPPTAKHESAPPPSVPEFPRTASLSRNENASQPPVRTKSVNKPPPPKPAAPVVTPTVKTEPENIPVKEEPCDMDFDQVKAGDPLKHMQRAKPPSKNPPSKFKGAGGADAKEVEELKSQVADLTNKMNEMEKKFKKLFTQVQDELDTSRKESMNQQIEIDRLKRQLEVLSDH